MVTVPWPSTTTHCSERSRCRCKLSLFPGATVILLTLYLGWSSRISNEPHGRSSLYLLETIFMLPSTELRRPEGRCDLAARCEWRWRQGPWQQGLSLIHISEPTRRTPISYAVFCLKKKNTIV